MRPSLVSYMTSSGGRGYACGSMYLLPLTQELNRQPSPAGSAGPGQAGSLEKLRRMGHPRGREREDLGTRALFLLSKPADPAGPCTLPRRNGGQGKAEGAGAMGPSPTWERVSSREHTPLRGFLVLFLNWQQVTLVYSCLSYIHFS